MTYFQQVTNAYRDSMMALGVSEDVINFCLYAFETGYASGTLDKGDVGLQQSMVAAILNEDNLN